MCSLIFVVYTLVHRHTRVIFSTQREFLVIFLSKEVLTVIMTTALLSKLYIPWYWAMVVKLGAQRRRR